MTALSEALVAAQRRAIAACEKAWLAGQYASASDLLADLDAIGATDAVDQSFLVAALRLLERHGAESPAENGNAPREPKPRSDAQVRLIERLCDERGVIAPDLAGLTMEQASKLITDLQRGTYDANEWEITF